MDEKIEQEYNYLLSSGMFWEFFPELTGVWEKDKELFIKFVNNRNKLKNNE